MSRGPTLTAALLALTLSLPAWAAKPLPTPSPTPDLDGLLPQAAALMDACLRDYNNLRFDAAEAEARGAIAAQPGHPLPVIYLQGVLVESYHEAIAADASGASLDAIEAKLDAASVVAFANVDAWEREHADARGQVYRGIALGAQGLVQLAQHHYLAAYKTGKQANEALLLAKQRDPEAHAADLGLGQYLYYCGRLSGLLRFILALKGDIPGGIALLESGGRLGGRTAPLARIVLARILTEEEVDAPRALPYVQELRRVYPDNWHYMLQAQHEALALGLQDDGARALALGLQAQISSGWAAPEYAKLDLQPLFSALSATAK
jgi:tetratricopeptide (TPR) repeat protein